MKTGHIILIVSIIIAICILICGFSIGLSNTDNTETNITTNNTTQINNTVNETINNTTYSTSNNKKSTSSQEDDPFSEYSEDVQAQANYYKSTHNHYSDNDNIVAHEYLDDGNARVYYGDGRSEIVSTR